MKPLALDIRSCSCRIANWRVAAIAVDDDVELWRDCAELSRATEPGAIVEPITPSTTRVAVMRPSAQFRFEATTTPEPDLASDDSPRRAHLPT
jgi:hypothetical protein